MRVERGRGALVVLAEPEAAAGDAAQAVERLGAEVTILRQLRHGRADSADGHDECGVARLNAPWPIMNDVSRCSLAPMRSR
jgi:hypothetical protein